MAIGWVPSALVAELWVGAVVELLNLVVWILCDDNSRSSSPRGLVTKVVAFSVNIEVNRSACSWVWSGGQWLGSCCLGGWSIQWAWEVVVACVAPLGISSNINPVITGPSSAGDIYIELSWVSSVGLQVACGAWTLLVGCSAGGAIVAFLVTCAAPACSFSNIDPLTMGIALLYPGGLN